jgi:outer membrane protein
MSLALALVLLAPRTLMLQEAERIAAVSHPSLRQAKSDVGVARSRQDEARAPLLPQVLVTPLYKRATTNYVPTLGTAASDAQKGLKAGSSFDTDNYFNVSVAVNQLLWDFGQTSDRWRAAEATTLSSRAREQTVSLDVLLSVRTAFFNARAAKALMEVARDTLANQQRHLVQTEGFLRAGTRPEIDLVQARTDTANAQVDLIDAENGYETAKAQLNRTMGVEGDTDYEVANETLSPIHGEELSTNDLVPEAYRARPELAESTALINAQDLTLSSVRGAYWPSLGASSTLNSAGVELDDFGWNWNIGLTLTWPIFQGLLTNAQVSETEWGRSSLVAQRDAIRQQVRLEVEQARLAVRAAKASFSATGEAKENATKRLRLAEGRYRTGVGGPIELGDAQVALTHAAAQQVQAEYRLSAARAQLLRALGRKQ